MPRVTLYLRTVQLPSVHGRKVLAQFAITAQQDRSTAITQGSQVTLLAELLRVVDETLQPEHVSVTLFDTASTQGRR